MRILDRWVGREDEVAMLAFGTLVPITSSPTSEGACKLTVLVRRPNHRILHIPVLGQKVRNRAVRDENNLATLISIKLFGRN
jgi:hypothetical protein